MERVAWAQAVEDHKLQVEEVEMNRAKAEIFRREEARIEAAAAARKRSAEHAMWYQRAAGSPEAHGAPLHISCIDTLRAQQQYRIVKDRVMQSILLMKAVGGVPGDEMGTLHTGANQQIVGDVHGPASDAAAMQVTGTSPEVKAVSMTTCSRMDSKYHGQSAVSVWQDNKMVLSAQICARTVDKTTSSTSSFISKLLGPRKFKRVKDRPRR